MNPDITPQQLTAINLKYGTTAKSLKTLAFADLSAKALFRSNKPLTTNEIAGKVAELINVRSVSEELINKGLGELNAEHRAKQSHNKWELSYKSRKEIEDEISLVLSTLNGVLNRHFPKSIDEKKLAAWFTDAIADFFVYNGDEWVQSICKGAQNFSRNIKTADELLAGSIKKHQLEKYAVELKNSFRGFLASDDFSDQRYLTNIGFAMFSARLVAADVGADPIALEELRNATFLVDTNFFFALQLDTHRFASSLETLGRALLIIAAKLVFIHETKEEYGRVWAGRKSEVLSLLKLYPEKVIVEADDDFISTAVSRECSKEEDFENFFQSIKELPRQIEKGPKIELLEDKEIAEETDKAKRDDKLKDAIQKWCLKLRPWWRRQPKSNAALEHDASLIYVSEFEKRSGNKVFILTIDRSLQACCADRAGSHEIPPAIYLEGLIQILAANNAGPDLDATNFAPLLTSILLKRCVPPEHMYTPQDLHWLYGIQKNIAGFKPEKIKQIAREVTKARLAGKTADDDKLQLTVNRFYQEEIRNTNRIVEESLARAREAEHEVELEKSKVAKLEKKLQEKEKEERLHIAKGNLIKALLWRIPATLVLAALVFVLASLVLSALHKENALDFVLAVCTLLGAGYKFLKAPINEYLEAKKSLR